MAVSWEGRPWNSVAEVPGVRQASLRVEGPACSIVVSLPDDRFPDSGKVELVFSATPEKIPGGQLVGLLGTVSTSGLPGNLCN